jgi:hypothetical protein
MLAALASGSVLTACNYGSSDIYIPAGTNPSGFYTGTRVSAVSGAAVDVVALVSASGELRIVDPASRSQSVAALSFSDDRLKDPFTGYAAPGTAFPDKSTVCKGTVSGTFQPGATIKGSYACGGDHGTFSLLYDASVSLQSPAGRFPVIGVLGGIRPGDVLFLAIKSDGGMAGSDSDGCTYAGQVSVIDPLINVYAVTAGQSCGKQIHVFTGLSTFGFIQDTADQALYLALSDSTTSIAAALPYQ